MKNILLLLLCYTAISSAQTPLTIPAADIAPHPVLQENFRHYELFALDPAAIHTIINVQGAHARLSLQFAGHAPRTFELSRHHLLATDYTATVATARGLQRLPYRDIGTYQGKLAGPAGQKLALTIEPDFFFGLWTEGEDTWFVEPLYRLLPGADRQLYLLYKERDIMPLNDFCPGAPEGDLFHDSGLEKTMTAAMSCFEIDISLAADFAMVTALGGVTQVQNFMAGVLNNVQTNYDNEFNQQYTFVIRSTFISNCASCDPWNATTDSGILLPGFRSWGNNNGFGNTAHDVASLWTNRDFDGSTIGLAYLNSACGGSRYNILQNFSANAAFLRVLQAHELGHNFNAQHDASGSGTIMAPSVNTSNTWSSASQSSINSFLGARHAPGCLAACSIQAPPEAAFSSSHTAVCPGSVVNFFDQSSGTVNAWFWEFPGGTPASSTERHPTVYYDAPGNWPVTLTVSNNSGDNSASAGVDVSYGNRKILINESFEQANTGAISNPDNGTTWLRTGVGGNGGSFAMHVNNFDYNAPGQVDRLLTPMLDFSQATDIQFSLQYAYRRYNSTLNDRLRVRISTDGGQTFPVVLFDGFENGSQNFATGPALSSAFTPSGPGDWCFTSPGCVNLDLSTYAGQSGIQLAIDNVNGYGNNMYIDNVVLSTACVSLSADFMANPISGCAPLGVQFTDLSEGFPSDWVWDMPGATPEFSLDQHPQVFYTAPGRYPVTLSVGAGNAADMLTRFDYIIVESLPIAAFSVLSTLGQLGISLNNQSEYGLAYTWNFGDGNSSSLENPTHTYAQAGTYTITLSVSNDCGTVETTQTVTLVVAPQAAMSISAAGGCAPLSVQYVASPQGAGYQYRWQFPGGSPASGSDSVMTVTYATAGSYSVSLIISNAAGADTLQYSDTIVVNTVPAAAFSSGHQPGSLTVPFTNQSHNADSYLWQFGDGQSSSAASPTHPYAAPGTYIVRLESSNACGTTIALDTITLVLPPVAELHIEASQGCAPMTVSYRAFPQGPGYTYAWHLPGGMPESSTDSVVTVTYATAGIYDAQLVVSNIAGSDTVSRSGLLVVNTRPSAAFVVQNTPGELSISVINQSQGALSYAWDFGDGATFSGSEPSHTYALNGTYTITLYAGNECGTDTLQQQLSVAIALPLALFTAAVTEGCAPLSVQFNNQSVRADSYQWSFPGGNPATSTEASPLVVYEQAGEYSVLLVAVNQSGSNSLELVSAIRVNTLPAVSFSLTATGGSVQFNNTSSGAQTYLWDFGDGHTSEAISPHHTYAAPGTYTVTLLARNACGEAGSTQTLSLSGQGPVADIGVMNREGCAPLQVMFSDESDGEQLSRQWLFPGAAPAISEEAMPGVVYTQPGSYDVWLIVSNFFGKDTLILSEYIRVLAPPVLSGLSYSPEGANPLRYRFSAQGSGDDLRYRWIIGAQDTLDQPMPEYLFAAAGTYPIRLELSNTCGTVSIDTSITIILSALNPETERGGLVLYPNPGDGLYWLRGASSAMPVRVFDALGRQVWAGSWPLSGNIDLRFLPAGVYWMELDANQYKVIKR
jgi:PKD repeat protein